MDERKMKKKKIKCPYFILLVLTSVLFTFLYQMRDILELTPHARNKGEETVSGNLAEENPSVESISGNNMPSVIKPEENQTESAEETENPPPESSVVQTDVSGNEGREEKEPLSPEEYLAGTLFIGDSRTSSLKEYAGWDEAAFYVKYGMTIWEVLEAGAAEESGKKVTVDEALQTEHFDRIYIMLGINELGRGTPETFAEQYKTVVERIRELQPEADIIVEAIMHVTQEKDEEKTYINNAEINARNKELKKMAEELDVYWLDVNLVTDNPETGCLVSAYSFDGVHLKVKYLDIWKDFILENQF